MKNMCLVLFLWAVCFSVMPPAYSEDIISQNAWTDLQKKKDTEKFVEWIDLATDHLNKKTVNDNEEISYYIREVAELNPQKNQKIIKKFKDVYLEKPEIGISFEYAVGTIKKCYTTSESVNTINEFGADEVFKCFYYVLKAIKYDKEISYMYSTGICMYLPYLINALKSEDKLVPEFKVLESYM